MQLVGRIPCKCTLRNIYYIISELRLLFLYSFVALSVLKGMGSFRRWIICQGVLKDNNAKTSGLKYQLKNKIEYINLND